VNGQVVATQTLERNRPDDFFEVTYPVPIELTKGRPTAVVRFQARPGNTAGGLFGLRVLRVQK
jgi:uncharacterized protein